MGETKLADNKQAVLACVQKAGFVTGTYHWSTGVAPPKCGTGTALSFDGQDYTCVATGGGSGGGGGSRIQCSSYGRLYGSNANFMYSYDATTCVDVQTGDICTNTGVDNLRGYRYSSDAGQTLVAWECFNGTMYDSPPVSDREVNVRRIRKQPDVTEFFSRR